MWTTCRADCSNRLRMNVVLTPGAREMFTPRELDAAYKDFTEREHYYLNAESGLKAVAYRFGTRMLIAPPTPFFLPLFTQVRGRRILGSSSLPQPASDTRKQPPKKCHRLPIKSDQCVSRQQPLLALS